MTFNLSRLTQLRERLLALHKTLLDYERKRYEGKYGRIESSGKFFQLVTGSGSFAWLRSLSELIVSIDELLDQKQPVDGKNTEHLFAYVRRLLAASQSGNEFEKKYYAALQKDPAVALAHAKVLESLKK